MTLGGGDKAESDQLETKVEMEGWRTRVTLHYTASENQGGAGGSEDQGRAGSSEG